MNVNIFSSFQGDFLSLISTSIIRLWNLKSLFLGNLTKDKAKNHNLLLYSSSLCFLRL